MPDRREPTLYPYNLKIDDLDPYEIITLSSLGKSLDENNSKLLLTKQGGYWPIMLTYAYLEFNLSLEDVKSATDNAMDIYLNTTENQNQSVQPIKSMFHYCRILQI